MGESRNHTVLEEAEDNLNNVFYTEEKLKFTFNRFVEIHRSAHNDMLSVPEYVVPNPATRVRKLLSNIRSNNPALLASITSVQTLTNLRNFFEHTVDTIKSEIRTTKITTTRKQRIYALTGGRGGRRGRGARGGRGTSDKRVRLNDHGNPPYGIDWVEDKFYEPGFYAKFSAEQKTRLHELRNNRRKTTPATQNVASVESRLTQLEKIASTLQPHQNIVTLHQGVSQVGVQTQYTKATNPALQGLNQRS